MPQRMILFVCTGNLCRSPMAEYLLKDRLGPESSWRVMSAGLFAVSGMSASPHAVGVLAARNIDLGPHRSRLLTREWVDAASLIVVMTKSHREQLQALHRNAREKVFLLRSFDPAADSGDLDDPIGATLETYREARDAIESALPGLVDFMRELQ